MLLHLRQRNILRDAWACWNVESQAWQLDQTFDHAFCEKCEADCTIDEVGAETVTS